MKSGLFYGPGRWVLALVPDLTSPLVLLPAGYQRRSSQDVGPAFGQFGLVLVPGKGFLFEVCGERPA